MSWLHITGYIFGFLAIVVILILVKLRFPRAPNVPGAPNPHWYLGNFPEMRRRSATTNDTHQLLHDWHNAVGPRVAVRAPGRYVVILSDPEDIHAVLSDRETFQKNDNFRAAFGLISDGLLVLDGETWHAHRKLVVPAFAPDYLREASKIANLVADKLLARWETVRNSASPVIEAHSELSRTAMDIIGLAAFNQNFNSVDRPDEPMSGLINRATKYIQRRVSTPKFLWRFLSDATECGEDVPMLNDFVAGIIKQRQETLDQPHRRTVLDMLLDQRKQPSGDGFLNDKEIKDEIVMLYLAGHETTANTMAWVLLCLTQNPHVAVKVQEELKRVLSTTESIDSNFVFSPDGGPPSYDDLAELPYLEQVIKETLRLYPVAPATGRQAMSDVEINGMTLPRNTGVIVNFYTMHRNPKYFPNPLVFDPERFNKDVKHVPNSFLPFGDGPKNCVGRAFAMVEAKTILARILQKYTVRVLEPEKVAGVFTITLGPKEGLRCEITPA